VRRRDIRAYEYPHIALWGITVSLAEHSYTPETRISLVIELSMVCRLLGHRYQATVVIREDGDFYEVDDARYCRNCGAVRVSFSAS